MALKNSSKNLIFIETKNSCWFWWEWLFTTNIFKTLSRPPNTFYWNNSTS